VAKASLRASLGCGARISGTTGSIELPAFMHCPQSVVVSGLSGRRTIAAPMEGGGLCHEAREVHRCLDAGEREQLIALLRKVRVAAGDFEADAR
jgi:hypothetical protein